jgi:hypothetical protein
LGLGVFFSDNHALPQMRRLHGFGEILEDHVERSHQDGDKHDHQVARLKSAEMRCASYSHHEKTANDPKVLAAKAGALEKTTRKRIGPSLAAQHSKAQKLNRDTGRSGHLTAEQMRPPSDTIQPHETTKLEFKEKSTQL